MSTLRRLALFSAIAAALSLGACGEGHDHDHDHDHDHAHDHGDHDHDDHDHSGHAHAAPHGGALAELGAHQGHVEFVLDASNGELILYVLDAGAEAGVRSASEALDVAIDTGSDTFDVSLAAQPNALSGESVGDSSVFVGTHESLVGQETFTATIASLDFKGQAFTDIAVPYPEGAEE